MPALKISRQMREDMMRIIVNGGTLPDNKELGSKDEIEAKRRFMKEFPKSKSTNLTQKDVIRFIEKHRLLERMKASLDTFNRHKILPVVLEGGDVTGKTTLCFALGRMLKCTFLENQSTNHFDQVFGDYGRHARVAVIDHNKSALVGLLFYFTTNVLAIELASKMRNTGPVVLLDSFMLRSMSSRIGHPKIGKGVKIDKDAKALVRGWVERKLMPIFCSASGAPLIVFMYGSEASRMRMLKMRKEVTVNDVRMDYTNFVEANLRRYQKMLEECKAPEYSVLMVTENEIRSSRGMADALAVKTGNIRRDLEQTTLILSDAINQERLMRGWSMVHVTWKDKYLSGIQ